MISSTTDTSSMATPEDLASVFISDDNLTSPFTQDHFIISNTSWTVQPSTAPADSLSSAPVPSAADFIEFKIGTVINVYLPPVIVVLGVVGNILSFLVTIQPHNRRFPPGLFMSVLAVFDLFMNLGGIFTYWLMSNFLPMYYYDHTCKIMSMMVNFSSNASTWIIVAMTINRLIVVVFPFKAPVLCTVRTTVITLVALCFLCFAKNVHYVFTSDLLKDPSSGAFQCGMGILRKGTWVTALQWFEVMVASIIPFIIILLANIVIITTIRRQSKKRQEMASGTKDKSETRDDSVTVLLVVVSLAFVLLTAPLFIFRTYFANVSIDTPYMAAKFHLGHHICHKLWVSNYAINFYLYVISGKKFREDVALLFRCKSPEPETPRFKPPQRNNSNNTLSTCGSSQEVSTIA